MAASSSSKQSPSSQPVASSSTTEAAAKTDSNAVPPAATTNTAGLKAPPPPVTEPTYATSEESGFYVVARALLNDGRFEEALVKIEDGIESTKKALMALGLTEEDISLHESMAPFHYLYGTTLLYSIEESSDSMAMTLDTAAGEGEDGEETSAEVLDDMLIAWENLDLARAIMERLLTTHLYAETEKLKLDLAQILLREGDLHRMNGRYENAIGDYESCLQYREGTAAMGPYDRKIADVHYNLGLVHMLLVAENKIPEADSTAEATSNNNVGSNKELMAAHRARSFHHYFVCGRTLCGQIAFLCGVDPDEFLQKAEAGVPNFKSTGEDDPDGVEHPKIAGMKLRSLRKNVEELQSPTENSDLFNDLCQLLQEIQETIDEAENSERGVHEVAEMKAEISAAVAGLPLECSNNGEEAAAPPTSETSIGFGTSAAAASAAVAQPVMAVKKKKRPPAEDSKMAADPSKRPKSE